MRLGWRFLLPHACPFSPVPLVEKAAFLHWIAFAVCQTSAGIFVEPFLGLWWTDSSNFILSSQNRFVAILVILPLHIYFRRVLSIIYQKILVGILIGIMLNLYINLGGKSFLYYVESFSLWTKNVSPFISIFFDLSFCSFYHTSPIHVLFACFPSFFTFCWCFPSPLPPLHVGRCKWYYIFQCSHVCC